MGKPMLIDGPDVIEYVGNRVELAEELSKLLKELQFSEIDQRSITILSSVRKRRSLLCELKVSVFNENGGILRP